MTPERLEYMVNAAIEGLSLPEIARSCEVSRQRIFQLLSKRRMLEEWREARTTSKEHNLEERTKAKLESWEQSKRGKMAIEAAWAILQHIPEASYRLDIMDRHRYICTPRIIIEDGKTSYPLRLSFTKTAHSCHPSGCAPFYYRAWRTPKSWLAVILPDGRKLLYAPVKKARQAYINADPLAPFPPLSIPAIVY